MNAANCCAKERKSWKASQRLVEVDEKECLPIGELWVRMGCMNHMIYCESRAEATKFD